MKFLLFFFCIFLKVLWWEFVSMCWFYYGIFGILMIKINIIEIFGWGEGSVWIGNVKGNFMLNCFYVCRWFDYEFNLICSLLLIIYICCWCVVLLFLLCLNYRVCMIL